MKRLYAIFGVLVLVLLAPFLVWKWKSAQPYDVLVVDKTVPQSDYREHGGLSWVLDYEKRVKSDGSLYDKTRDYYGYHPSKQTGDTVLEVSKKPDLIYITDTYGVYTDDLRKEGNTAGERSQLVYGGMNAAEWEAIDEARGAHTTLIGEFNTLASPTSADVRHSMEDAFGMKWSGWIGRYFPDLASEEVPVWVRTNYEKQTGQPYQFKGQGLLFTNESDRVVVLEKKDFNDQVWFTLTDAGQKKWSGVHRAPYQYWFDIMTPNPGTVVLAQYQVGVTASGQQKLAAEHIPTVFPAVLAQPDAHTYYFAGDYADLVTNTWTEYEGITLWKQLNAGFTGNGEFYWRTYVPMMQAILGEKRGK